MSNRSATPHHHWLCSCAGCPYQAKLRAREAGLLSRTAEVQALKKRVEEMEMSVIEVGEV
jgi:hypothetical protein